MRTKLFYLFGILTALTISFFIPYVLLPSDILYYLPSFSVDSWQRPHNSLLADVIYQFEPWRFYAKERILRGEIPLWNHLNNAPFLANPQTTAFYPLNLIYYLLPATAALNIIIFLKIILFGFFSFLYFRSIEVRKSVSVLAASVISLSGFFIAWLQWPHTNVYLFFPFLLYCTEKYLSEKIKLYKWLFFFTIAYFLAILGGHPETLFLTTLIYWIYVLIRFYKKWREIPVFSIPIIIAFLLASFHLFPFLEYIYNSYMLESRAQGSHDFLLPAPGLLFLIFPFILGAPHLPFYRPLSPTTNFQELIGGYVGPLILLLVFLHVPGLRKNRLLVTWVIIVFISLLLSYNFWPISDIFISLPVLNLTATHRLSAFIGFGIVTIFAVLLNRQLSDRDIIKKEYYVFIRNFLIVLCFMTGAVWIVSMLIFRHLPDALQRHGFTLIVYVFFMLVTTLVGFVAIMQKRKTTLMIVVFSIIIFLQTGALFLTYNTVSQKNTYIPRPNVVRTLMGLPKGMLLEVGNPSLPPNLNIFYNILQVENDDALQIKWYKNFFDKKFPVKNHWKKVDAVNLQSLQQTGIKYVISDYDLNAGRFRVQTDYTVLHEMQKNKTLTVGFKAEEEIIKQIRFLPANYNRQNTCVIQLSLFDVGYKRRLASHDILCSQIRDKMFYTTPFLHKVTRGTSYHLVFSVKRGSLGNTIGLWGSPLGEPYIEIFYEGNKDHYKLLFNEPNVSLWEVPDVKAIEFNGSYTILKESPESLRIKTNASRSAVLTIKKPFYPGWKASIDGNPVEITNSHPFIKVNVPEGSHLLGLTYVPQSFMLGLLVSVFTSLISCMYLLRKLMSEAIVNKHWKSINKKISSVPDKVHGTVLLTSFITAASSYIILAFLFPLKGTLPYTTSINWHTVNNYPKQLDIVYFVTGFFYITGFTLLLWFVWLWKKRK